MNDPYFILEKSLTQKALGEVVQEICLKTEPKPLFCELPDDLKLRFSYGGTTPTYTTTSSLASGSIMGTSATTTF